MTARIHESAASYAVEALDPADQVEFEAHLAGCGTCQAAVVELHATVAELSLMNLATPPPALRDNVLAAVRVTSQLAAQG